MAEAGLTVAAFLLLLLGFGLLALKQDRHRERVLGAGAGDTRARAVCSTAGYAAIAAAPALCVAASGPGFGALLWAMLSSAAALLTALLLTWCPQALRPLAFLVCQPAHPRRGGDA